MTSSLPRDESHSGNTRALPSRRARTARSKLHEDLQDPTLPAPSRQREALKCALLGLRFAEHPVQVSDTPLGALPITYVGHSRTRNVTVHNSYVYIDQGVREHPVHSERRPPTVIDHEKFSFWLGGVVTARERMPAIAGA